MVTEVKETSKVPPHAVNELDRLIRYLATGHITFHLKDGRIMEIETLVKTRV